MDDLERASGFLNASRKVAVLSGAGVSAESGIPTFRGLGGLWKGLDPFELATPEAFTRDPALVWEFYNTRRGLVAESRPNPAHLALAELARRVPQLSLITQNVDRLHQRAGSLNVLELHGNLLEVRCSRCARTFDRSGETLPPLPRCELCGGLTRPSVVWFGEALPADVWSAAERSVRAADVLIVVGTSAVVYPAAGLVATARRGGTAVIEVNLEPTPVSGSVDVTLLGKAGEILPRLVDTVEGSRRPTRPAGSPGAT